MMDSTINAKPSKELRALNSMDDSLFIEEELSRRTSHRKEAPMSIKSKDVFSPKGSHIKPESSIFSSLFGA